MNLKDKMANTKVKFKVHTKQKLAEFVYDLRNSFPKENLSERNNNPCIYIDFSSRLINKILKSKKLTNFLKKEILKEISLSEIEIKKLKNFNNKLKNWWSKNIADIFFNEMKKMFGKKFLQKNYICYPTNKITGSYFGKNEITIIFKGQNNGKLSEINFASFVLAEEILHLIYWELWEEIYCKKIKDIDEIFSIEGPRWSCWHIAEILPEYVLIENPLFKKFKWREHARTQGYPWIPELKKILDPLWIKSKDIKDFVIKSHKKVGIEII